MPRLVTIAALALLALLAASFAAPLHPVGDSLAVFRLGLALAALAFLPALLPWPRLALAGLIGIFVILADIGASQLTRDPPGPLTVYQKNMWFLNHDLPALEADIRASGADIVMLQEVSVRNATLIHALRDLYPHRQICAYTEVSGIVVLTRLPVTGEGFCGDGVGLAALRLDTSAGPAWALSLHMIQPYPYMQAKQTRIVSRILARLDAPAILGGDLNTVPWSHAFARLERAGNLRRAGAVQRSFFLGPLPLPIDHVLAPGGGTSALRGLHGSDHYGLLAQVHLAPRDAH